MRFQLISLLVGPTGIEPVPLVLQTSVRTSYTKGPILTTTIFTAKWLVVVQGRANPSARLGFLSSRFRNLTTVVSPCLWDTVESNHTLLTATILQTAYHTSD